MIRRPPRSTQGVSSAASDVYKRQTQSTWVSGAGSKFPGFASRILNELKDKKIENIKLKIFAPNDRESSCWSGGSILSSLATFREMWIPKKEIEEQGSRILHTKAF
eukprot:TRINITY_DN25294_c0_g3_i5.p1 TRINITY_DN25294_c0_g3~~TRINITY_DN25294_c0_g3_i5.p1  ORF type:complete len:106 (-),score=34.98 TRINITY_DN25294_c0_g3_i5:46-363(-)